MSEVIKQAAESHEAEGGGRSAFSFVCGAEYIIDQIIELSDNPIGRHLVIEYANKMKEAISNID